MRYNIMIIGEFVNKQKIMDIFGYSGLALAILMVFAVPAMAQSTTIQANGALSLQNLVVSPQPVVSGDNVNISFQLFNSYSSQLQNVNLSCRARTRSSRSPLEHPPYW